MEFSIIQLKDRTDSAVTSWASAKAFAVIEGRYFITDILPKGDYYLLSTKALPACFNTKSRTVELCGVTQQQLDQEDQPLIFQD